VQDSITFSVNPGDDFYVVANLSANAQNGIADGWGTLNLQFANATGLTPAAVPLPATIWLFAAACMGIFRTRRSH
jgi:hypothetical protein